jgi:hypothetical protein
MRNHLDKRALRRAWTANRLMGSLHSPGEGLAGHGGSRKIEERDKRTVRFPAKISGPLRPGFVPYSPCGTGTPQSPR